MYFLKTTRAVCPNINPIMHCEYVCDVDYAACYYISCWIAFNLYLNIYLAILFIFFYIHILRKSYLGTSQ